MLIAQSVNVYSYFLSVHPFLNAAQAAKQRPKLSLVPNRDAVFLYKFISIPVNITLLVVVVASN